MSSPSNSRRIMLLTGASRGIGHATVKRFSAAGWRVITCSRHGFPENCPWEMGPEDHLQVDLSNAEDTLRAIAEVKERLAARGGCLHALVNNAGISPKGPGGARLGALETAFADWQHVFQVNFFGPILLARGLRDELARDFGPLGVRVNAISPGEIDTAILSPGTEKIVEQIPLQRLGTPDEVAKAIYFLCTDASAYVTGAELHINGGQHV